MNPVPAAPFTDSQATKLPVLDQLKSFSNSCYCFHGSLSPGMRSILIALPLYVNCSHVGIRDYLKRLRKFGVCGCIFYGAKVVSQF